MHYLRNQGQGIGSLLLDHVEVLAPICRVFVVDFRVELLTFYERRGYVETSREPVNLFKVLTPYLVTFTHTLLTTVPWSSLIKRSHKLAI